MATLILTGAIVGSLQWSVLRGVGHYRFRWWPVASALGWVVGQSVTALSWPLLQPITDGLWQQFGLWEVFWIRLVGEPLHALWMAAAQSLVLVGHRKRWIGPWLLASLLGGAASGAVGAAACAQYCPVLPSSWVGLANGAGWAAYGIITGIAWLALDGAEARED